VKRCLVSLTILAFSPVAFAENWPQWRGPTNDGICKETGIATEWSDSKNVLWKLKMPGTAGSTPAIWGDRIFLTSAEGNDTVLLCVSTDGKELWKRKLCTGGRKFRDESNEASASPCTDGKHVWAFTGTGEFACFDFEGKEVWRFNAQEKYGNFRIMHGMHVTPLLEGDRLYLSLLHAGGMWVLAFDKATGKEVWKVERPTDGRGEGQHSYASPCLWRNGKDAYLVVHGCDYATAHRLSDGKEIWRLGDLNPKSNYNATLRFVASPAASADVIVIPTAKGGPVVAVKPDATGAIAAKSNGEQWRLDRGTPDVPTPIIHDGLVYLASERGILTLLDAKTGKQQYSERLHSALYRASPVLADGKLYVAARDGTISVVKAGPKFELLATNKLPDTLHASPVIANGRIYLRGFETLYAVGEKGK
jgi:outer membrane protein assembly factor BamB